MPLVASGATGIRPLFVPSAHLRHATTARRRGRCDLDPRHHQFTARLCQIVLARELRAAPAALRAVYNNPARADGKHGARARAALPREGRRRERRRLRLPPIDAVDEPDDARAGARLALRPDRPPSGDPALAPLLRWRSRAARLLQQHHHDDDREDYFGPRLSECAHAALNPYTHTHASPPLSLSLPFLFSQSRSSAPTSPTTSRARSAPAASASLAS